MAQLGLATNIPLQGPEALGTRFAVAAVLSDYMNSDFWLGTSRTNREDCIKRLLKAVRPDYLASRERRSRDIANHVCSSGGLQTPNAWEGLCRSRKIIRTFANGFEGLHTVVMNEVAAIHLEVRRAQSYGVELIVPPNDKRLRRSSTTPIILRNNRVGTVMSSLPADIHGAGSYELILGQTAEPVAVLPTVAHEEIESHYAKIELNNPFVMRDRFAIACGVSHFVREDPNWSAASEKDQRAILKYLLGSTIRFIDRFDDKYLLDLIDRMRKLYGGRR